MSINEKDKPAGAIKSAFESAGFGQGKPAEAQGAKPQGAPLSDAPRNGAAPQMVNSRFRRTMSRAPTSQVLSEAKKALEKDLKETQEIVAGDPIAYTFDAIDQATPGVRVGAVLLLASFTSQEGKKTLLVYAMALEGSIPSLSVVDITPRQSYTMGNDDRRQVYKQLTVSDLISNRGFQDGVVGKLKANYGQDFDIILVGSMTVPREIDFEKDVATIHAINVAATGALDTVVQTVYRNEAPLTVQEAVDGYQTSITMEHNSVPGIDAVGEPLRKDVTLTLRTSKRSQIQGEPDEVGAPVALSGYVDLFYTQPPVNTGMNQREDTRRFTPVFVINELVSLDWNLVTLETKLLALSMAPIMATNEQYLAPFMSRATGTDSIHDAGAIGHLVNFSGNEGGQPIGREDMSTMSTKDQVEMLRMSIFPDLHVAMAVAGSAPSTWIDQVFVRAAQGEDEATRMLVEAANRLTGGHFSQKFQGGPLMQFMRGGKLFGHWTDKSGEIRDLADLDSLWALNVFGESSNPDRIWDFYATFLQDGNPEYQMAERWKIISSMYASAKLTDTGALVSPSAEFLEALTEAVAEAGLVLRAGTILQDFSGARGRASFQAGRGINSQAINSAMGRGFDNGSNRGNFGGYNMGFNRFGRR